MISRRRFLTISAAATCSVSVPAFAKKSWVGRAFGAEVSIHLRGEQGQAQGALEAARDTIRRLENHFSIYNSNSLVSRLNRQGELQMPPEFARLMDSVDQIHRESGGLFDPTVQPLFAAMLVSGGKLQVNELGGLNRLVGWNKVHRQGARIAFATKGMAITLNGIAQGFATDRVSEVLAAHGFVNPIVNIGEYRVGEKPAPLTVQDSNGTAIASLKLQDGAMATSSSNGFNFRDGASHILSPTGGSHGKWNTVSIVADTATQADGFSTALLLADGTGLAKRLIDQGKLRSAIMLDQDNRLHSL